LPLLRDWPAKATTEEATIRQWWGRWPKANVGIRLGEASGIIDFECDSPEEEAEYLSLWTGDAPPTSSFASSVVKLNNGQEYTKKHFLFGWRADLPARATVKLGNLTVKLGGGDKGTQSVFPPSIHPSGSQYRWLADPDNIPPAELTDEVVTRLANWEGVSPSEARKKPRKTSAEWEKTIQGQPEGVRNVEMTSYIGMLLRQTKDLKDREVLRSLCVSAEAVNQRNRPPMEWKELETIFQSVLTMETRRRAAEEADLVLPERPEDITSKTPPPPKEFRLTIIKVHPRRYALYAKQFSRAPKSRIELTGPQLLSPEAIRLQAAVQADYPLPRAFCKSWDKPGGLYERLMFAAQYEVAPAEEDRDAAIADRILELVNPAPTMGDAEEMNKRGAPRRLQDGSVVFSFRRMFDELHAGGDKVERLELSRVLKTVGATWAEHKSFKRLDKAAIAALEKIAGGESGEP
jgi:hypothetical protein